MNIFSFLAAHRVSGSLIISLEGLIAELMVNYDHDHNARDAMIDTVIIHLQSLKTPAPVEPQSVVEPVVENA